MTSHFLDNCATHLDLLQLDSRMLQGGKTIGDASMESYYAYNRLATCHAARAKKIPPIHYVQIFRLTRLSSENKTEMNSNKHEERYLRNQQNTILNVCKPWINTK